MMFCRVPCVLLLLSLLLCGISAGSQPDLRYRRLVQKARATAMGPQDWNKQAVEDFLSQLTLPEDETLPGDSEEARTELERSVDGPNSLPPRERKAGCKNFYWKGFTSC